MTDILLLGVLLSTLVNIYHTIKLRSFNRYDHIMLGKCLSIMTDEQLEKIGLKKL